VRPVACFAIKNGGGSACVAELPDPRFISAIEYKSMALQSHFVTLNEA